MSEPTRTLPDDPEELKQIIVKYQAVQSRYEKENELLREQIRLLQAQMFGRKSEKGAGDTEAVQLPLFDMPEPEVEPEVEQVEIASHQRQKPGRKKLPENLPRETIVHDIAEQDKICGCGVSLTCIGEDVCEKLDIIPAVIRVIKHVRPKYACKNCEGLATEGPVVKIAHRPGRSSPNRSPRPVCWPTSLPPNSAMLCRFTGRSANLTGSGRKYPGRICATGP